MRTQRLQKLILGFKVRIKGGTTDIGAINDILHRDATVTALGK